ncbi:uncharacterized protein [Onthophagus taurus]|uniref:uncharacterized protein n=1 Tax=Onthophagus taurus TaxID=166361 RepID=UPI000C1FF1B3|nr:uncharacterized protein LOC111414996 [Onthophagus taurus]
MEYDKRIKLNAFQGWTTYKDDYRKFSLSLLGPPEDSVKYQKITPEHKPLPPCVKFQNEDHETFVKFNSYVPMDLLWEPRPIVQTNPRIIPPKFKKSEFDPGRLEAIKTRPRLFVSPAIPLDDVAEGVVKDLILKNTYTTTLRMAQEEVMKFTRPIKRETFETCIDRGDPVACKVDKFPSLPQEWRSLSAAWDKKQKRSLVDPTQQFWLNRPLHEDMYAKMSSLVPQEVKDHISELIDKEEIRYPHDQTKPLYTGLRPRLASGVPLEKTNLPIYHPLVSSQQAIAKRWEQK